MSEIVDSSEMKTKSGGRIADILFAIQLVGAIVYCGSQMLRSLADVHGISIVQFFLAAAFVAFNFILSIGAHRVQPGRRTAQALVAYVIWIVGSSALVAAVLINGSYKWSLQDNVILVVFAASVAVTMLFAKARRLNVRDPMILSLLAITSKSVPQVFLAWKVLEEGGSGIPGLALLIGHFTIMIRLGQIYFMVRESGWERNRFWLAISEGAAELTWILVSLAWLAML
jgi:hypothetical protein